MAKIYYQNKPYRGVVNNSNELAHWKYTKKVRKNGKWIYYYDETTGKKYNVVQNLMGVDERDRAKLAAANYERAKGLENAERKNLDNMRSRLDDKYYRSSSVDPSTGALRPDSQAAYDRESRKILNPQRHKVERASARTYYAGKEASKAIDKYSKTPLAKINKMRSAVGKGAKKVASFLNKIGNRLIKW